MGKISLQTKSFFNSIGLDINNIPSELKTKTINMKEKISVQDYEFLNTEGIVKMEPKYFRLKSLIGLNNEELSEKSWLEIFVNSNKCEEAVKMYFKNPNFYFKDLRKLDNLTLSKNNPIVLYEDEGNFYIKDESVISIVSLLMIKYLLEMSRATTKEERALINKQYIFAANVIGIPKDRDIIRLMSMVQSICGTKLKIEKIGPAEECAYNLKYGEKKVEIRSKNDLENFIKNNYLPKEYESTEKLKSKIDELAQIGINCKEEDLEDLVLVMGKLFPNYEIFLKYYKKIKEYDVEDKMYEKIDLSNISYEIILKRLIKLSKLEEKKNNIEKNSVTKNNQEEEKKNIVKAKTEKEVRTKEKKVGEKMQKTKEISEVSDAESLKKNVNEELKNVTNKVEMIYYKLKAEESKIFELANEVGITLNIDRISDDNINAIVNSIKSNCIELKNKISAEEDTNKLKKIREFVKNGRESCLVDNIIGAYKDEMHQVFGSCLNKHVQKLITDSKLEKLELEKEEIEAEKCSFFSKLIGKAKLKQAKLDNINLKKQLILSESQSPEKTQYFIEDGLSDLYTYVKSEENEKCLVEPKKFIRLVESNMQVQNLIDSDKLSKLMKEKLEQKRNLPQLVLSKEKRRLFSKAQINLMEEKNNELKRVIQITRANSLKQQNTGVIPILGNIKTTKAISKFCNNLNKLDTSLRSLL